VPNVEAEVSGLVSPACRDDRQAQPERETRFEVSLLGDRLGPGEQPMRPLYDGAPGLIRIDPYTK